MEALSYCQLMERMLAADVKCAALAAENAGLNKFIKDDCFIYTSDDSEPRDAYDFKPETPATDAFLAEVRAQGVEMLVKHCEQKALEKSYDFFMDAGAVAAQFATQLRKEAAQ